MARPKKLLEKLLCLAALCCLVSNSSFAQSGDTPPVGVSSSATGRVAFSGIANNDARAGAGAMMYGPGLGGAVATLVLQGIFTSSAQNAQKAKAQEQADTVLLFYADALEKFEYPELMEHSVKDLPAAMRFSKDGSRAANEWKADVIPSFKMTQDESAIMVESLVSFYSPTNVSIEKPDHKTVVRVWSTPEMGTTTSAFWTENNAERLKNLSAQLTRQSIQIAMNDWVEKDKKDKPDPVTVRYLQGKSQGIERAHVLHQQCDRVLLRTLRNILVSAPVTAVSDQPSCAKQAPLKKSVVASPETALSITKSD